MMMMMMIMVMVMMMIVMMMVRWLSEQQARYTGHLGLRPTSAPNFNPRIISLMDNQVPGPS